MSKSSLDSNSLASVLIAGAAGFLLIPAGLTWLASILGLVLLVILLSYDEEGYRTIVQSLGFAGACAFCLTLASVIPYQYVYGLPTAREPQLISRWLPMTCGFVTLLVWVIDRARMGARVTTAPAGAAAVGSMFAPRMAASPAPVPVVPQAPVGPPPPPPPPPLPVDVPAAPHLVRNEVPVAPAPPQGPMVDIYVHLTGESLNLMRSVRAESLGRDYDWIVDTMPENETWQFTPGQVVRCKKQNLSTGKAMVAIEEAPRAH